MDIKVDEHTVLVFDLDDTLYNELEYLKSAYRSIADFLQPDNWLPLYSKMFSLYRCGENVFEKLSYEFNVNVSTLVELYRNHEPTIELFDGAIALLEKTKENQHWPLIHFLQKWNL